MVAEGGDRRLMIHSLLGSALNAPHIRGMLDSTSAVILDSEAITHTPNSRMGKGKGKSTLAELSRTIADRTGGYTAADTVALIGHITASVSAKITKIAKMRTSSTNTNTNTNTNTSTITDTGIDTDIGIGIDTVTSTGTCAVLSLSDIANVVLESLPRAFQAVGPSCLRGASVKLPDITYDDIIGYVLVLLMLIELCHGYLISLSLYLSMPMCLYGCHIKGSYQVVHWRANAGVFYRFLQYSISLA